MRRALAIVASVLLLGCGSDEKEDAPTGSAEAFCEIPPETRRALAAPLTFIPHDYFEAQEVLGQMREDFTHAKAVAPAEIKEDAEQSLALVVDADDGLNTSSTEAEANDVAEQMAEDGAALRDDGSYLRLLKFQADNCPKVDGDIGSYP